MSYTSYIVVVVMEPKVSKQILDMLGDLKKLVDPDDCSRCDEDVRVDIPPAKIRPVKF